MSVLDILNVLKHTHGYKLKITDINDEKEVEYYITDNMYYELYQLLREFYKKTDTMIGLPYIIPENDLKEKSLQQIKDMYKVALAKKIIPNRLLLGRTLRKYQYGRNQRWCNNTRTC